MATDNTATTSVFNDDTYRINETPRKIALKFQMGSESTGEAETDSKEDATDYLAALHTRSYLTNQFRRQVLERSRIIPNVIDDIKQEFLCIVTGIDHDNEEFTARITDVDHPENPDELVSLDFDEIEDADQRQLAEGDSFNWYIGYVQGQMVSRQGFSKIRFRRLPAWSQQEIDAASDQAEELAHFFHRDPDTGT